MALPRSFEGNADVMIAYVLARSMAVPTACTTRAPIRNNTVGEAAHRSAPTVKTTKPIVKTWRRPATSPTQPSVNSRPMSVIQYATFTQRTVEASLSKASTSAGYETLTIPLSIVVISVPIDTTHSTSHLLGARRSVRAASAPGAVRSVLKEAENSRRDEGGGYSERKPTESPLYSSRGGLKMSSAWAGPSTGTTWCGTSPGIT